MLQLFQEENRAIDVSESHSTKSSTDPPPPKKRKLTVFLNKASESTITGLSLEEKVKYKLILTCLHQLSISKLTSLLYYGGKNMLCTFPSLAKLTRKLFQFVLLVGPLRD